MNPFKKILSLFTLWRIVLFVPVTLGMLFLEFGSSFPFFEVSFHQNLPKYLSIPILTAWANFDGVHYLNIAHDGYVTGGRFFPSFPILLWLLSLGSFYFPLTFIISLIVPNVIFLAVIFVFLKLLRLDYSEKISSGVIFFLLLFPTSFFFITVYSEGLFLLLTLGCFYFMRKKMWFLAAFLAMLLTATRFVGIIIIPALIFEYLITERPKHLKSFTKLFLISAISVLGLVAYSVYNYFYWGNFLHFIAAQGELNNGRSISGFIFPLQTVYRYFKILTSLPINLFEWWIALLELVSFIFGGVFLIIAWIKKIRLSYLVFGVLAFLFPSLSGTFSGLPRYILVIFPIFIALALINNKYFRISYFVISSTLLFVLLMFFTKAYFIA